MPLDNDGFSKGKCGFKLIQFLALGIPVVASPIGTNPKIVDDGENGFLCTTKQDWLDALEKLISDAGLRGKMGVKGREKIARKYSFDANKANFLSLFQ